MKDYYFDLFKKSEYSLEYLDSLSEDELKDYFCEQTWDDEEGVINADKCKTVPFDQFAGMCNAGMINPSEWWIYLTQID